MIWNYVAVAIGGVVGCCARFGVTELVQYLFGRAFPLATLSINVSGCLVMGFLFFYAAEHNSVGPNLRIGLLSGVLGGFTTFSAFAMETVLLAEQGKAVQAVSYVLLSVFLGLAATLLGAWLARSL
jgi:CrcB protein